MTAKAKGDSVRQKLSVKARKLGVNYAQVETVFLIERLLARLTVNKNLSSHLVFKGGFVGLKIYESPRYTIDLDALLVKSNLDKTLELVKEQASVDLDDGVWFRFESQIDLATQGEYGGIRHVYRAGIGEVLKNFKIAQIVHFDLGIGDPITPGPKKVQTKSLLETHEDISWSVYPLETIIAEKLHALISHGDQNSRSKDIYDLCVFLPKADKEILQKALENCFAFRTTKKPDSIYESLSGLNTDRLKRGWPSAVGSIPNAENFESSLAKVLELIKKFES